MQSNQDRQPLQELNTDLQHIQQQNARQTQRRINTPQEETLILRKQNTQHHAERRAEMTPEECIEAREINTTV
jgi:hypothetical protein